jgi:hypothetical protein
MEAKRNAAPAIEVRTAGRDSALWYLAAAAHAKLVGVQDAQPDQPFPAAEERVSKLL